MNKLQVKEVEDCLGIKDEEGNTLLVNLSRLKPAQLELLAKVGLIALAESKGLVEVHRSLKAGPAPEASLFFTREERRGALSKDLNHALNIIRQKRDIKA